MIYTIVEQNIAEQQCIQTLSWDASYTTLAKAQEGVLQEWKTKIAEYNEGEVHHAMSFTDYQRSPNVIGMPEWEWEAAGFRRWTTIIDRTEYCITQTDLV